MQSRGRIIFTGNFWEYFIQSLGPECVNGNETLRLKV